jgi:CheY-like chemotaxis protein
MKTPPVRPASTGPKILLVDDVAQGTIARKTLLLDLGYQVETAECGEEALSLIAASEQAFDVVVTDYKMPGINGVELIRLVRASSPATKIVLLSGWADTLGLTAEGTGADVLLSKCAGEVGELTRTVKNLLVKRPARRPVDSQRKPPLSMVKSS